MRIDLELDTVDYVGYHVIVNDKRIATIALHTFDVAFINRTHPREDVAAVNQAIKFLSDYKKMPRVGGIYRHKTKKFITQVVCQDDKYAYMLYPGTSEYSNKNRIVRKTFFNTFEEVDEEESSENKLPRVLSFKS